MDLNEKQWKRLERLIPAGKSRGRPRLDNRNVLNGILWILRTGAPWKDVPERYPSYQTCHRRFQEWTNEGVMPKILEGVMHSKSNQGRD